jgi:DNA polymerase III epsilon subunit family exonuclease
MDLSSLRDMPLSALSFVAFDTETTGLDASFHRIVEIGAVKFSPGSDRVESFATLVDPKRPMPPEVIPVHGITDEMVAGAPFAAEALTQFSQFCGDQIVLLAHNAPFDLSFLGCESDRTGVESIAYPVYDTVEIARTLFPELYSFSLESLARSLQLAASQEHRALADAVLVRSLFEASLARLPADLTLGQFQSRFREYHACEFSQKVESLPSQFSDLRVAVEKQLRVEILYSTSSGSTERRVIRPFLVHSRQSFLYVSAFCELAMAERTFRLDRITELRLLTS